MTANIVSAIRQEPEAQYLKRAWPSDSHAELLLRAITGQATTTQSGWAADIVPIGVTPMAILTPQSAAGRLAAAALPLEFQNANQLMVPKVVTLPTGIFWTAEPRVWNANTLGRSEAQLISSSDEAVPDPRPYSQLPMNVDRCDYPLGNIKGSV